MRRRRQPPKPAIEPSVLDVLVHGWREWSAYRDDDPDNDALAPFLVGPAEWPALYREHRQAVEAEARTRGLRRSWAAETYGAS